MPIIRHVGLVALCAATAAAAVAQPQVVILTPPAAATTPLEIAGYAYDHRATADSGILQLEIWAFKDAKPPGKYLGRATLGFDRIDFARFLGLPANFNDMGFALTVPAGVCSGCLEPGVYDIGVFSTSNVDGSGGPFISRVITVLPPLLGELTCGPGQVAQWTGAQWECAVQPTAVGPPGPAGPQGIQGIQGIQGPPGIVDQSTLDAILAALPPKLAFVTSTAYTGDLVTEAAGLPGPPATGLAAGDALCQSVANAGGHTGAFKAWLSDSTGSPSTTFVQAAVPYVRVDGIVVANDWDDLVDGGIQNLIDRDQNGGIVTGIGVWTGTTSIGSAGSPTCQDWTSGQGTDSGDPGWTATTGPGWTAVATPTCDASRRVYCFEQ